MFSFRCRMEKYLEEMFKHLHATYRSLESRLKAEGFKTRVLQVLKAWDEWLVYHREFILKLRTTFLGIQHVSLRWCLSPTRTWITFCPHTQQPEKQIEPEPAMCSGDEKDDEDLDGVPLDGAALLKSAIMRGLPGAPTIDSSPTHESASGQSRGQKSDYSYDDDIDGIPRNYHFFLLRWTVRLNLIRLFYTLFQLTKTSMAFHWIDPNRTWSAVDSFRQNGKLSIRIKWRLKR